jgi:hypothetical protein
MEQPYKSTRTSVQPHLSHSHLRPFPLFWCNLLLAPKSVYEGQYAHLKPVPAKPNGATMSAVQSVQRRRRKIPSRAPSTGSVHCRVLSGAHGAVTRCIAGRRGGAPHGKVSEK